MHAYMYNKAFLHSLLISCLGTLLMTCSFNVSELTIYRNYISTKYAHIQLLSVHCANRYEIISAKRGKTRSWTFLTTLVNVKR